MPAPLAGRPGQNVPVQRCSSARLEASRRCHSRRAMLPPVRSAKRSKTAQYVAQVRAVLADKGVIDDPYAFAMLSIGMKAAEAAMARPPLERRTNSPFFASLAARTLFFDREVASALDGGIRQVVIIGAGCDSRAWRFARP